MPDSRLLAVLTAMMFMCGGGALRAEISLGQLRELEQIVASKNSRALWHYLHLNPAVLEGSDPLAQELRKFCGSGGLSCYNIPYPRVGKTHKGDKFPDIQFH